MPDFVIKTQFRGADKISPILKKMGIKVKHVGDQASRSFRKASKSASVFGGVLKGILAAGIIRRGFTAASMAVRGLAEEFVDFDVNITKAVTRLPGELNRTSKAFIQLSKAARVEAAKTEFTAGQTAKGVEQLALAGFKANEALGLLPGVLNLATNADVEVADATKMAVKSLGAFGLRVGTVAEKQANLTRVNDVFSRAISSATLDIETMFETLKFAGPAMFAAGQDIETFGAAAELMADRAIDASIAGTSLRMAFTRMAKPPREARVALKRLKIEIAKKGVFRDFADIIEDIEKKTAKMDNQQKLATITTIFGVRAQGGMNALLSAGSKEFRKYRLRLQEAQGASKKMADTIRTSLGNRLKILKSSLIELGFKFIKAFDKDAGKSLDRFIAKVRKFDIKPVIQGVKDTVRFMKELFSAVKPFLPFMPVFIGLWASYRVALLAVTVIQAAQFFVKLAGAIKVTTGSLTALKVAMIATAAPVALMTIAITGLVAALAILIVKNDDVVSGWEDMFFAMEATSIKIGIKIKNFFIGLINGIIKRILGFVKFVGKVTGLGGELLQGFKAPQLKLVDEKDIPRLKEIKRLRKDIAQEALGLGVARGAAGIRGFTGGRAAGPKPVGVSAKGFAIGQGQQLAAQAAHELGLQLQAPNRSEVEAQKVLLEGRFSFDNPPAGMSFEQKTTGMPPVSVEGLGQQ